jgi:hypothetical protein
LCGTAHQPGVGVLFFVVTIDSFRQLLSDEERIGVTFYSSAIYVRQ